MSLRRALVVLPVVLLCGVPLAYGDRTDRPSEEPRPNDAQCGGDRIAGVWRSRSSTSGGWTYLTTLHVQRVPGDASALRGRIQVTAWSLGGRRPPPCAPGQSAYQLTQPARGRIEGLRVDFRGLSARFDRVICGSPGGYNPDHFTGTLDAGAPLFRAVNNDNGTAVNHPELFRRIRCN